MFLELVRKEFIQRKSDNKQSKIATVINLFLRVLVLTCLIALECYIALNLDKKIVKYSSFGSFDFLVLALFFMMGLNIIFTLIKARKSIFDYKDNVIILTLPIESTTKVFSKVTYLYIEASIFSLFTCTPLLICYGATRGYIPYYYIYSFLYPFISSLFSTGISLLLSIVYQKIYKLIKRNDLVQFVLACLVVISACYLYRFVLNLFLTVLNDSSIGGMFSLEFVFSLHQARYYFLPVYHLLDLVIEKQQVVSDVLIFLGSTILSILLGIGVVSASYLYEMKQGEHSSKSSNKIKKRKLVSPFKSLIKKEFDLLFKDETNLFSYTSLLILCPFLTYVVISSLNSIIYENLRFYASYFPELISGINLCLILLFVGVINTSASLSVSREGKSAIIIKYLPISPLKQILAKILIPFIFSLISLAITLMVLFFSNTINLSTFLSSLFIGFCLIAFTNIFGIYADMKDKCMLNRKIKLSIINEVIPLIVPFVIFLIFFIFSIYIKLPSYSLYLISCMFSLCILLSSFICFKTRYMNAFNKMEVNI